MAAFDAAAPATWTVDNLKAQTNDALAALLGQHNLTVDKDDDRRDDRKGDARLVKADYVRTWQDTLNLRQAGRRRRFARQGSREA